MLSKPSRCLLLAVAGLFQFAAEAGVYKCLGPGKRIFYQDKPCQDLTSTELSPELANLAPKDTKPHLLWKMTLGEKSFYILGALPFGSATMFPLPKALTDAFNASEGLVLVNAPDIGDAVAKSPEASRIGFYTDDTTLLNHVKTETWRETQSLAKKLNLPEEKLAAQKPWLAALTLKNAALKQSGFDDKMAISRSFLRAAEASKPVVEIDSVETQVDRYERMTGAEQEHLLLEALYEANAANGYFKNLAEAFIKGDDSIVALTEKRVLESLDKPEKSMLERNERLNQALAEKIFEMTADGRRQFVVIDARYLVGEDGVIARLEEKGYSSSKQ